MGDIMGYHTPNIDRIAKEGALRGDEGINYGSWLAERMLLIVPAQAIAAKWTESFKEFPPRQKPASFSLSEVMEKMETASPNQN